MGFLTTLFERRSLENPSTPLSDPDDWLYDALGSSKSNAGVRINRETALTYSAIWKGTTLIAGDVGKLPLHIYRIGKEGRRLATEHPAYSLLRHKPNDAMGAKTFRETIQGHAILDGNGYAYIWRNGDGSPREITILAPRQVTPVRVNGVLWYVYQFTDGTKRKLPSTDVIHVKGFSYDGLMGYNLIHKARESFGWAMGMQTYGATFFKNNATPRVILEHPRSLKPEAAKNLRESWERLYAGLENSHRTAVLEEGLKANVLGVNAKDAQLIEQLKFTFTDVANWLKLPPHKVGGEGRTAYASLEQENQAYLDDCLDCWLVTWEEECRDKLLTEEEKASESHEIRFARRELLRANLQSRGEYYTKALQWGWMNPDEIRDEEGYNPIDGGEGKLYLRPLNVGTFGGEQEEEYESSGHEPGELIDIPDIQQPDAYSCGAAAAMSVGQYFGVGPATIAEWKELVGTTPQNGTHPMRIMEAMLHLGLVATAKHKMTVDELQSLCNSGKPVICCVQSYGANLTGFANGHYVVALGVVPGDSRYIVVQDPSATNVIAGAGSAQAPGRVMIEESKFVEIWHDIESDGDKYMAFGIAISDELDDSEDGGESSEPETGQDSEETSGNDDLDSNGVSNEPDESDERSVATMVVRSSLYDAVRRMATRLGHAANRVAAGKKNFIAWLDSVESSHGDAVQSAFAPVDTALAALRQKIGIKSWFFDRFRSEMLDLSGKCTVDSLPGEISKLTNSLSESLAVEADERFLGKKVEV